MSEEQKTGSFYHCEVCRKRLIKRLPNGLFHFEFGRKFIHGEGWEKDAPVCLFIHGNIKIKCLDKSCGHWNIFNFFPQFDSPSNELKGQEPDETKTSSLGMKGE